MRKIRYLLPAAAALLLAAPAWPSGPAQTPRSSPNFQVMTDNKYVKATKITIGPGVKIDVPIFKHGYYHVIQGGSIKVVMPSGEAIMWTPATDEAGWIDLEEPHSSENVGKTTVSYITVELK